MITSLLALGVWIHGTTAPIAAAEPVQIARAIQVAVDRDGGRALERAWRSRLATSPRNPQAIFAVATFERSRYRYERADSLYRQLDGRGAEIGIAWRAMAQAGMAAWRAMGSEPARADSLYSAALISAQSIRTRDVEAEVLLGLAGLRGRSQGPKVAQALLTQWWNTLPDHSPTDSAQRLCLTGAVAEQLGDTTGARRIARGADAAERLRAWRIAGSCRLTEAQTVERRGYIQGASYAARMALAHYSRIRYDAGTALASQWYGYVLVRSSRFAQARALLEQAIISARITRFESVEAWAHSGLANLYLVLGDLGLARAHAAIASNSHAVRNDRWGIASSRGFEAAALAASGDLPTAAERYTDAHAAFVAAGLPLNGLPALVARARLQLRMGQLDSAERTIAMASVVGQSTEGWRNDAAVLRAGLAMRRGQFSRADSLLRTLDQARGRRTGTMTLHQFTVALFQAQVALRRDRVVAAESALAAITSSLADWRAAQQNRGLTASLAQLNSNWDGLSETAPDLVAQLIAHGRLATAFAFVEQLRAREIVERALRAAAQLTDSSIALRALPRERGASPVVTIDSLQRVLSADEAFVSYTLGIDDAPTTAIIVTRDTAIARDMPSRMTLVSDIARFTQLAVSGIEARAHSRRLGEVLLAPVFSALPATVTRLILSLDGELHRVPFDALRLPDGRFAVERATISTAPSATALMALRARSGTAGVRVLVVGDPRYPPQRQEVDGAGTGLRTSGALTRTGVSLPRLRHSGDEARRVARYGVRSTLLLGVAATENAIGRTDWSDVGVLHVAAHALVNPESQTGTAIALSPGAGTDGFLLPAEIALLDLRGSLVVLSSCHTSGGQVLGGEGLRGLTAPLLEAGARAVVATHWSIGDRSVVPFVDRFYAAMATGARVDDALRQAKLAAIRDGVSLADWGSFAVIGDGAMRMTFRQPRLTPVDWLRGVITRDSGTGR